MGSSCSSGQGHKDKDSVSSRSEESPSYQANARKDSRGDAGRPQLQEQGNHSVHSGVILEAASAGGTARHPRTASEAQAETATGGVGLATPSLITIERKPMKVLRSVATSSVSADSISLSSPPGTAVQSPRDFDKLSSDAPPLPPEVQQLPDNLQSLLLGQVAAARVSAKTRKIVVYVCAADSQDCCVEKGALHNTVYPELREHCRANGYELHVVDLHWKTGLEKQQDHEFPELCLGELARQMEVAYVVPVLFLSNSLGTPLLPGTIETQDFEMAVAKAEDAQLLRKWYQLDAHAQPPCYRLQPISSHIPGFKESSPEEKERALREWRSEIERTLAVMVTVFPQELRDTYLTTVVEQEVHNTVFMSQELARRCLWLCRVFTPAGPAPEQPSVGEAELARRLEALQKDLRNQLSDKHILRLAVRCVGGGLDPELPEHAQYVSEVAAHMARHLRACVDAIVEEDQAKAVLRPSYGIDGRLFEELMQQTSFCQRAAQCSINREAVLHSIRSYVVGESRAPLVLHGPRGCGKSTLVARAAQCCHAWQPECALLVRVVGVTASSSTTEGVLRSLLDQCCVLAHGHLCWDAHNMESYRTALSRLLTEMCLQRPTLIVIDNLDQVREYGTQSVDWLPAVLPENVKLILSVAQDSPVFAELKQKIPSATFVEMPSLGKAEAEAILMSSVMQYNHSVSSHVQDCVRSSVQDCTLPLYVKVLAWQTSWWSGREHGVVPKGNVTDQLRTMLDELESILGKERVAHSLALATASKNGLCDSEMLDLLAHDARFHSKDTYVSWAPSCLFWAGLNKYLAPFMRWSGVAGPSTLRWRDALLLEAIRAKYDRQHAAASVLADYYQGNLGKTSGLELAGRLLPQPNKTGKCYNQRKLEELPYQMFQLHRSIKDNFLFDQSWLFDKLCGAGVYDVLEDIFLEESAGPERRDAELAVLRGCLEQSAGALSYDGRQFYSQMHVHLSKLFDERGDAPEHGFLAGLLRACRDPPVPSLVPAGAADTDEDEPGRPRFDAVTRLGDGSGFVATVSTEREEIAVWDACSATRVRTLVGVTHPISLKPVDERRCVVLCRRELRVYDLDAGRFVARLKGVMNQKMPYYGLHDPEHLVTLSRNRMYVNLMNMESGDCVTTFKAGEDRFLNSLLVSGDGRVLVCGDETQKPFPLLVWNLASRKLLYDLRIPHHDFVTNLAAITFEGHYVCCVAKEVDEPSPNFIVVYDLQSGTLFKKWKPGVSTVSLDISSRDGCVISGLEDARILVWDLITGNCRWSLSGHTAPVDFLRLDPQGGCVLSADSCCRDRSLRLWDLSKGELLAVHTPARPATSRELLCGGRVVVLALRGRPALACLRLLGPGLGPAAPRAPRCYGRPENTGRTFHLRDDAPPER